MARFSLAWSSETTNSGHHRRGFPFRLTFAQRLPRLRMASAPSGVKCWLNHPVAITVRFMQALSYIDPNTTTASQ